MVYILRKLKFNFFIPWVTLQGIMVVVSILPLSCHYLATILKYRIYKNYLSCLKMPVIKPLVVDE